MGNRLCIWLTKRPLTDTLVDLTFGMGMSVISEATKEGVVRNAEKKKQNSTSRDQSVPAGGANTVKTHTANTYSGGSGRGGPGSHRSNQRMVMLF